MNRNADFYEHLEEDKAITQELTKEGYLPQEISEPADPISQELIKANITDILITRAKEKGLKLKINGVEDRAGYREADEHRKYCKKMRNLAVDICKKGRENAIQVQKAWVAKEKEVAGQFREVEEYLEAQLEAIDLEKERIKKEAEAKELKRLEDMVDETRSLGANLPLSVLKTMTDGQYQSLLAELRANEAERIRKEQEEKEAQELELARQRQEDEERQKAMDELREKLEAEARELERQKAELAQREAEAAQAKADAELRQMFLEKEREERLAVAMAELNAPKEAEDMDKLISQREDELAQWEKDQEDNLELFPWDTAASEPVPDEALDQILQEMDEAGLGNPEPDYSSPGDGIIAIMWDPGVDRLSRINTGTMEGMLLWAAIIELTTKLHTDKTPDEVIGHLTEIWNNLEDAQPQVKK